MSSQHPAPSATATDGKTTLHGTVEQANQAVNYVSLHWENWVTNGIKIVFIAVVALVVRALVIRLIDKLVDRMAHGNHHAAQNALINGLLANAERRRQRSQAMGSVLRSVASFVILGTAAITILPVLGINLAPLLASAGVAGVAIGFGARNLVTDFLSGVFMIIEDQYGVGDQIDTGVATGTVLEVGLRVTKLRGANGEIWYIRNGEVKRIANLSQGWATANVEIPLGYHEDLDKVEKIILSATEGMSQEETWSEQLWEPVKVLGVDSLAADAMIVHVQAKVMPGKALGVGRELRRRIKEALEAADIRLGITPQPADVPAQRATPADIAAPSALGDPNSSQSRATAPIPGLDDPNQK
ncbi:mechanosensitive ion channel family protein [Streptacidiphilus jiangxiensis]|uniref:Small conductance mechanosensitive channel n=1 Tax=Streptacidiphilus jiangxiensis TaxID=235985 RepID=A0A1H7S2S7_STRJI|nr:mechanosensitive ion channel family protein [Streptacidiphilus jiangxiensis]SEL66862.1 small conductance mechanosensitive channel [Streptacidiphilus jiangxiensis]